MLGFWVAVNNAPKYASDDHVIRLTRMN